MLYIGFLDLVQLDGCIDHLGLTKIEWASWDLIVDKEQLAAWLLAKEQIKASVILYKLHTHFCHNQIAKNKPGPIRNNQHASTFLMNWVKTSLYSILGFLGNDMNILIDFAMPFNVIWNQAIIF